MGKAQPLDAKVKTLSGWKRMGELRVGEQLASIDGTQSRVSGIFPQGRRQVHRVTFSDGRSTECCGEHLWQVYYRDWPQPRVLSTDRVWRCSNAALSASALGSTFPPGRFGTDERSAAGPLVAGRAAGRRQALWRQRRVFHGRLGDARLALRANGWRRVRLCAAGGYDWRIVQAQGHRRAGVPGVTPNESRKRWLALDFGAIEKRRNVHPSRLPHCVARCADWICCEACWTPMVGSSGGEACASVRAASGWRWTLWNWFARWAAGARYVRSGPPTPTRARGNRACRAYVCNIHHDDPKIAVPVSRTSVSAPCTDQNDAGGRCSFPSNHRGRATQCISVTHPSRLYITDDYVVTHNTSLAMNIAEHVALEAGLPVGIFSHGDGEHAAGHAHARLGGQARSARAAHRAPARRGLAAAHRMRSASSTTRRSTSTTRRR